MNPNNAIILMIVLITLILGLGTWFLIHAFNTGLSEFANNRLYRGYPVGAGGLRYMPPVAMPGVAPPPPDAASTTTVGTEMAERSQKADA